MPCPFLLIFLSNNSILDKNDFVMRTSQIFSKNCQSIILSINLFDGIVLSDRVPLKYLSRLCQILSTLFDLRLWTSPYKVNQYSVVCVDNMEEKLMNKIVVV